MTASDKLLTGDVGYAHQIDQELLYALERIDRPGSFCTSGQLPATIPGLEVNGVGPVPLPLEKSQAASLKKKAVQAPYGRGEQTLVDLDVRHVWEIDSHQITLANPEWTDVVKQAVRTVQSDLGLENQKLESHFYKLLLYEPGSFFLSHRDGEKLDRMVATLVIALPSAHEGGELLVRHEGREKTIHFDGPGSRFHTRFAAFYADCEHEVLPVKSGFRLSLVYNLTLAKPKQKIAAPTRREHIDAIARILEKWSRNPGAPVAEKGDDRPPDKLAVLLDHQYTRAGLIYEALKGIDRAKAAVLMEAARRSGCDAHLALVTHWQYGSVEPTGEYWNGDPWDDDDGDEYTMEELLDWSLTAEHFSDPSGHRVQFGQIPLQDDEIVSKAPLTERKPDGEELEGYTGNEGATMERWYHWAAVILWPAESHFSILCEAGTDTAVAGLEQMMRHLKKAKKSEQDDLKKGCFEFASRIIDYWPGQEYVVSSLYDGDSDPDRLLPLLDRLGEVPLIARWMRDVLAKDVSVNPGKSLGDVCRNYGWRTFEEELRSLFDVTNNETIARNAWLLADISLRNDKTAERREICRNLAKRMQVALERWDARKMSEDWRSSRVERSELLPRLVRSFIALETLDLFGRLVNHVLGRPKQYDFTMTLIPAVLGLQRWLQRNVEAPCSPLQHWLAAIREELETRAANPPSPPADWRRASKIPCKCEDCTQIIRFLDDPGTGTLRLPLAKQRRKHLHQIIDGNRLDLTHVTERRGRPYTLVCTKTNASYDRALNAHRVDLNHLKKIRAVLEWHESLPPQGGQTKAK